MCNVCTFAIKCCFDCYVQLFVVWTSLNAPGLDVTAGRYTPLILPPKEEYEFRVIVENMLGRGVFKFPGTFTVREGSSTLLSCKDCYYNFLFL